MKESNQNFSKVIFLLISLSSLYILIYNIFHFNPILGYDAEAHFSYVDYLSRYLPNELRLPSSDETREFFNPPLGYIIPTFAQVFCSNSNMVIKTKPFLSTIINCMVTRWSGSNKCSSYISFYDMIART